MNNRPSTVTNVTPRRTFLKSCAGLAAAAAALQPRPLTAAERKRFVGANSRIRIAQIGCGNRGRTAHMEGIYKHVAATNFEIVALADPWRKSREEANVLVKKWFGRDARQFVSHGDLLAMDDIDAVMIASPDHLHTDQLEAAAKAGKHIYVEKPLAMELDKLVRSVDAVKAAGTVVQVGTQWRSYPGVAGAREVMQSGILGKISRIEEVRNAERPYWYNYLGRGVTEAEVEWKEFLGDRAMRRFTADQYEAWYGFRDFCQGPTAQWTAHFLDCSHYIMNCGFPSSCVSTGGIFTWKDEHRFTTPDCVQATWIYPEGFLLTSSTNFGNSSGNLRRYYGTKGTLSLDNAHAPSYSAEGGPKRDGKIRGKTDVPLVDRPDHFLNWLECMRTGAAPHASIDEGYKQAVAVLMAAKAFETGRTAIYDPQQRVIRTV